MEKIKEFYPNYKIVEKNQEINIQKELEKIKKHIK